VTGAGAGTTADALTGPREDPREDPRDPDELALVAAGFPEFRLWRETTFDHTRYVARSRDLNTHPHTVVTTDLAELAATLVAGRPADERR
jgi:hypothetical protein